MADRTIPDPDYVVSSDHRRSTPYVVCPSTEAVLLADGTLLLVPTRDRPQLQVDAPWGRMVHDVVVRGRSVDSCVTPADRGVVEATIRHLATSEVLLPRSRVAAADVERYDRQVRWLAQESGDGPRAQRRLAAATAVVLGVGGFGSAVAELLGRAGVGRLVLVDFDRVEEANLCGQLLYEDRDVGTRKVFAAATHLERVAPHTQTVAEDRRVASSEEIGRLLRRYDADLLVCAADSPSSSIKRWVDDACFRLDVPTLHAGTRIPFAYVGPLVIPGQTQCFGCFFDSRTADGASELERVVGEARDAHPSAIPSAAWCDGAAASVAVAQLIALLTGAHPPQIAGRRWEIDLRTLSTGWGDHDGPAAERRCARCRRNTGTTDV